MNQHPPTLFLKAPFLKIIRERTSKYLLQLNPAIVQWLKKTIYLSDGHRTVPVFITKVEKLPIGQVKWIVLDSIGYKSREALKNSLMRLYGKQNIEEVIVLEVIVQPKQSRHIKRPF